MRFRGGSASAGRDRLRPLGLSCRRTARSRSVRSMSRARLLRRSWSRVRAGRQARISGGLEAGSPSRSSTRRPSRAASRASVASIRSRSGRSGCSRSNVSAEAWSAAIGVRSSWEASARNRLVETSLRSAVSTAAASASTIRSNAAAMLPSSVSVRLGRKRTVLSPAAIRVAVSITCVSGRKALRVARRTSSVASARALRATSTSTSNSRLTARRTLALLAAKTMCEPSGNTSSSTSNDPWVWMLAPGLIGAGLPGLFDPAGGGAAWPIFVAIPSSANPWTSGLAAVAEPARSTAEPAVARRCRRSCSRLDR